MPHCIHVLLAALSIPSAAPVDSREIPDEFSIPGDPIPATREEADEVAAWAAEAFGRVPWAPAPAVAHTAVPVVWSA